MRSEPAIHAAAPGFDRTLLFGIVSLVAIGIAFIYSAVAGNEAFESMPWYRKQPVTQVIYVCAGLIGMAAVAWMDYRSLARWCYVAFWISILLLILVLIPGIGKKVAGARRWLDFGITQFQPSELAKLTLIFALAHLLSRPLNELRSPGVLGKCLGMTFLPFALILLEPDLGSALIFLPICFVMMLVAGVPARYLKMLTAGGLLLISLVLVEIFFSPRHWMVRLEDYQRQRLLVYFGLDFAPRDATPEERKRFREIQAQRSYQVRQAMISVGSGGFWGKGWRQGTQIALGYLPRGAAHNDFIFSVIAEEKGFVGSVIVLSLYGVVLFSGIRIAAQARDRLGKLLAVGVVALLFSHVFINIGMNIRLMPVTGVPLPLLSHGGSSVACTLIAAGILQNVHRHRKFY